MSFSLWNETKGRPVVECLEIAKTPLARMKGLLGRNRLEEDHALLIEECRSVHTWFMRFAIDVVFLDDSLRVRKVVSNLVPWRLSASREASHVLELPAGSAARHPVEAGDVLKLQPKPAV